MSCAPTPAFADGSRAAQATDNKLADAAKMNFTKKCVADATGEEACRLLGAALRALRSACIARARGRAGGDEPLAEFVALLMDGRDDDSHRNADIDKDGLG